MPIRIGINGFGRIGRLFARVALARPEFTLVQINDPGGDAATFAHLLSFDSVHGRLNPPASPSEDGKRLHFGDHQPLLYATRDVQSLDWSDCDWVLESSGVLRQYEALQGFIHQGAKRVLMSAPSTDERIPNLVVGVNHQQLHDEAPQVITAASCTTNCLAPLVKVIHEAFRIVHGSMTTIHAMTNDQSLLDAPHSDLRRARTSANSLIPTKTGAAAAIGRIFPELAGRLDGHAVRIPLPQGSLTDAVFEVATKTDAKAVNRALQQAANGPLAGILGYEERPLVSVDFRGDPRSSIVDALSTLVVNGTQVKVFSWYDNEWGYVNRVADLMEYAS